MSESHRVACIRCRQSVFNCLIDGPDGQAHRVPLYVRLTVGQPEDTGGELNTLDPNIRVPSFVRQMTLSPLGRINLCMTCFAEVFGVPLVSPAEDPMYDDDVYELYKREIEPHFLDVTIPKVERFHRANNRALHAMAVAWGEAEPDDVPEDQRPRRRAARPPKQGADR